MRRDSRKILIRAAILVPMMLAMALIIKPITSKAWSWYKPWTWPVYETVKYTVSDWIWEPTEGCPMDDELMARVIVDGLQKAKLSAIFPFKLQHRKMPSDRRYFL